MKRMKRLPVLILFLLCAISAHGQGLNHKALGDAFTSGITQSDPYARYLAPSTFANLGTPSNGAIRYCSNCAATSPCTSGGSGASATRVNGAWNCSTGGSGAPGGSSGDIQYNNAGAFGGLSSTGTGNVVRDTSPALTTPTGIVKSDVGLSNVDNTSDATKNSAVSALTNKDLTSGTNSFPTSLATLTGVQVLTNKDLTSGTNTFPTSLATLTGSQALTNKSYNGLTLTSTTGTFTLANGKTLTVNNSIGLTGTDGTVMTFPSTSATVARTDAANTFTGEQTFSNQIIIPVGANNAPKIQFAGDTASGIYSRSAGFFNLTFSNANRFEVYAAGVQLANNMALAWSSSTPDAAAVDTGITRASAGLMEVNNGTASTWRDLKVRQHYVDATMTAGGTTGAQTINKAAGSVNFAASASSLVVTDSLVTANSIVICTVQTNDTTATIKNCVPASGSFTITLSAAATAETKVAFLVINQ